MRAVWLVAIALIAAAFATPPFALLADHHTIPAAVLASSWPAVCVPAVLAVLIARRRPGNRIAWALLALGAAGAVTWLGTAYSDWALQPDGGWRAGGAEAAQIASVMWPFHAVSAAVLVILFPDGRLPSPRWRRGASGFVAAIALAVVADVVKPGPLPSPYDAFDDPLGIDALRSITTGFDAATAPILLAAVVAAAYAIRQRLRRADGIERLQIRWLALAALLVPITMATVLTESIAYNEVRVAYALGVLTMTAIPAAVGVAVLRYRLYDIDVVINRTLVYGALTTTLGGTYVASVLLLQLLLGGVTGNSGLAVAISTLGVAALVRPARARIQGAVDRRFYRRKYDAQRTVEAFAARLRDEVQLDRLSAELQDVVAETMQPARVSLWLREANR
jgi:hypothetical protein